MSTVTGLKIFAIFTIILIWTAYGLSVLLPADSPITHHVSEAVKAAILSLMCIALLGLNRILRDIRVMRRMFVELGQMAIDDE